MEMEKTVPQLVKGLSPPWCQLTPKDILGHILEGNKSLEEGLHVTMLSHNGLQLIQLTEDISDSGTFVVTNFTLIHVDLNVGVGD